MEIQKLNVTQGVPCAVNSKDEFMNISLLMKNDFQLKIIKNWLPSELPRKACHNIYLSLVVF